MGFHNRHLDQNILRIYFNKGGVEKILELFKADAITTCDKFSSEVSDIVYQYYYHKDETRLRDEIKQKFV